MIGPDAHAMPTLLSLRLRKTLAWLALCAMCLGVAVPTVSRWLAAAAQAADLVAICDGHGMRLVAAADLPTQVQDPRQNRRHDGHSGGGQSGGQGDCCPYCALTHHCPGALTAAAGVTPHAPLPALRHAETAVPTPALRAWRKPHMPQAPPPALA
jgi:hypothetical protein